MVNALNTGKQMSVGHLLKEAQQIGEVATVYKFPEGKKPTESEEEYIDRLRGDALKYQFVKVPFQGKEYFVAFSAPGSIITPWGKFVLVPAEVVDGEWGKHNFLFYPDVATVLKKEQIHIRISSGCYSGMVLGDTTCDCQEEFSLSEKEILQCGSGVVVDIPGQDGRGWNQYKMVIQRLMDELHLNTIEAAKAFYQSSPIDRRTYHELAIIMSALGFTKSQELILVNSNPLKTRALEDLGLRVAETKTLSNDKLSEQAKTNLEAKKHFWKESSQS